MIDARDGAQGRSDAIPTIQGVGGVKPSDLTDGRLPSPEVALSNLSGGFVYFIRAGRTPSVKIGWALDPERRLDALQTGCPHKLHLIGFAPGEHVAEQQWHDDFRHRHSRGEWFILANDLRDAINSRLSRPDATRYIHIKQDWRAIRKAAA